MADSKSKAKDERTADEIRRDIAATRARLAAGVENLVEEVHPATLKREASDRARDFVQGEFDQSRARSKMRMAGACSGSRWPQECSLPASSASLCCAR
ncbi:hypothetical protein JCM18909_4017 [Cutibacterium acnes JCM 18909]|nr:hypothetical protein JCM18909_4017 [Cutibacterium acnes JCM 18909]